MQSEGQIKCSKPKTTPISSLPARPHTAVQPRYPASTPSQCRHPSTSRASHPPSPLRRPRPCVLSALPAGPNQIAQHPSPSLPTRHSRRQTDMRAHPPHCLQQANDHRERLRVGRKTSASTCLHGCGRTGRVCLVASAGSLRAARAMAQNMCGHGNRCRARRRAQR